MLDMDYGYFPYVTRSRVGTQELELSDKDELYLVTRAYQTRHGRGPFNNEKVFINAKDETNVFNEYQGEFKVRALNIDEIVYVLEKDRGIKKSKNKYLVITCLDQMTKNYPFIYQGELHNCSSEEDFLEEIRKILLPEGFKWIYTSHGPTAKDIKEYLPPDIDCNHVWEYERHDSHNTYEKCVKCEKVV